MKALGVLLLVLGLTGLLLNLIFWLPAKFDLVVVVFISAVCLAAVCAGGRLSQPKTELVAQPAGQYQPMSPQAQWSSPTMGAMCPKCSSQIMPGQQFCGGCGSNLVSYCAKCGVALKELSRFCGKCGAKLS